MLKSKLTWRYATKKMDAARVVPQAKVDAILDAISLAPTSSGVQPFEVIVVTNPDVKAKLREDGKYLFQPKTMCERMFNSILKPRLIL